MQAQWPAALPGYQRLLFDGGRITLDLWLGDINQLISKLDDSLHRQIDAWFLDGFAPSKNPDMYALQTVLCYDGYLTPVSPQFGTHYIGASYHRGDTRDRLSRRRPAAA